MSSRRGRGLSVLKSEPHSWPGGCRGREFVMKGGDLLIFLFIGL